MELPSRLQPDSQVDHTYNRCILYIYIFPVLLEDERVRRELYSAVVTKHKYNVSVNDFVYIYM